MVKEIKINEEKIKKLEEQMKTSCDVGHVKFCPKCGSEDIGVEAEALSPHDYCRGCGHNSIKKDVVEVVNFPTKLKN